MIAREEIVAVLEAILFVSPEPVSRQKLFDVFDGLTQEAFDEALDAVAERHCAVEPGQESTRGIQIDEVAGGVRLVTRPDLNSYLRKFFEVTGRTKLSMAALETLAIVAYRQPITGPEIQELRSRSSSGVLKTLLEKRLIRISGRREVVGKPFEYATTRDFLMHFGLAGLEDLPPLEEFEETFGADLDDDGGFGEATFEGDSVDEDREERIDAELLAAEEMTAEEIDRAERGAADEDMTDEDTAENDTLEAERVGEERAQEQNREPRAMVGWKGDGADSLDSEDEAPSWRERDPVDE